MHPKLITLWEFNIYTYGFFLAVAFIVGVFIAKRFAEKSDIDPEKMTDLCIYTLIGGIVFSRLFYVFTNPALFKDNLLGIFKIWEGGLVFYGGFIGALLTALVYMRFTHLPFWKIADILSIPVAVGHGIGRIGCFFAGCCYGKACDLPWAVVFNHPDTLAQPRGVPLHPTQLYSVGVNLTIALFLFMIRKRTKFDGQLFWIYILLYGISRSIVEIFRGDFRGAIVFGMLSISQTIGIAMSLLAVVMLLYLKHRNSKACYA